MTATIYKITNLVNSKFYVGFTTKPINRRLAGHLYESKLSNRPICRAIRKYGIDSFKIEEIYQSKDHIHTLNVMEPYFISKLTPHYNVTLGGEGVLGYKHNQDTIEKCRQSMLGKTHSEETKFRMSQSRKGRIPSNSTLQASIAKCSHPIVIDNIKFQSKNSAAKYLHNKYNLSRNTALRRIASGVMDFRSISL